jgi:Kdo2-lipid IVA lauroyltransferase/acyltransferase
VKNFIEYIFFIVFIYILRALPLALVRRIVVSIAFVLFKILGIRKKVSLENLKNAFPEKDIHELNEIAYNSFKNFSLTIIESMYAPSLSEEKLFKMMQVEDKKNLDEFFARKNGKIILTAHFGNWEYLGQYIGLEYKIKYPAIVKRMRNHLVDKYVEKCRNRFNYMYPLYMDKNVKEVFKVLQSGKPMAILADQSAPQEALYIKFFNRYATTFQGAAVFALRCKASMRMILVLRNKDYSLKMIHEEIKTDDLNDSSDESVYELSKRHVEMLEKYIRKYPDQWLWSHKRWKHSDKYEIFGKMNTTNKEKNII